MQRLLFALVLMTIAGSAGANVVPPKPADGCPWVFNDSLVRAFYAAFPSLKKR